MPATNATTTTTTPDASTSHLPATPSSTTTTVNESPAEQAAVPSPECSAPQPSIPLLFSLVPRRDFYTIVLPAILSSVCAGGVAPFMTLVVGEAFDAFAKFPVTSDPSQAARNQLTHDVGITALELLGLAIGALALSSITSSLWIWTGERNLMALRKQVYAAVTRKDMVWFDTKMGAEDSVQSVEGDGPVGAGGLMAKFARDTDDVRMASSLASGMIIQYLTTCVTCLALAFSRSWSLTLIILSAVPCLMFIQAMSQAFAGGHLQTERAHTSVAATLVDRALAAIATVKAFNAETHEQTTLGVVLENIESAAHKVITVWGVTSSLGQFVMMAMFVQGFWFGAKLVRDGTISAGAVMAVFWACLIATSNLQMCVPQLIVLAKGKFAMASLLALVDSPAGYPQSVHQIARRPTRLRKIVPRSCKGQLDLDAVTFAYPSRPTVPVLQDITIFVPAREITFIVGGSGSGKSTIAQLLLRMYESQHGSIRLDDQDMVYLDEDWTREQIAAVSQSCILFDMSVHDNVAMGLASPGSRRRPEDVSREEVEAVCRAALMHEFVRDLPDGYDTQLGTGGANLSGGQKQRLAIARALLRNPTVLILDEATSALDATSRILVFEAIKLWRTNLTTIVITHDLSQITLDDFVHVLKDGMLVEQGYRDELEGDKAGEFHRMVATRKSEDVPETVPVEAILEQQDAEKQEELAAVKVGTKTLKHQSIAPQSFRPLTMGNWMFDVVADLTKPSAAPSTTLPVHDTRPL
ncbi:P-loop containing nucleoside triphosphate hydrolase protein, partial [Amylocystis lapponica]